MPDSVLGWINDGQHDADVARFVLEGDDWVHTIVKGARDELPQLTGGKHTTFASAVAAGDRESLRAAAEAIYFHLKRDYHLHYEYERAFDDVSGEQHIRLPAVTKRDNAGTCIDLVVLYLSCLAAAKLAPIFVFILPRPREAHALAAVRLGSPRTGRSPFLSREELCASLQDGSILAIECIGFTEGCPGRPHKLSFEEACTTARSLLESSVRFRFALDVRRARQGAFRQHLRLDRATTDVAAELDASLALSTREGLFQRGGLCAGSPLRSMPDRYFVAQDDRPDWAALVAALSAALAELDVRPICAAEHYASGPVLCKLAALIRGTPFGVYPVGHVPDRNVSLQLGIAVGLGRPFVLIKDADAAMPPLLAGLDHFAANSYLELRHELGPKVRDFLIEVGRYRPPDLPPAGSRDAVVIAHGGLDVLDFSVAVARAVDRLGLTPLFLDDPTGKLKQYLELEGLPGEVLTYSGDRLSATVAAIQSARLGIYRLDALASVDTFVALGVSLALSRPGLLVRRAGNAVPVTLEGLWTIDFRSSAALSQDLVAGCRSIALSQPREGQP